MKILSLLSLIALIGFSPYSAANSFENSDSYIWDNSFIKILIKEAGEKRLTRTLKSAYLGCMNGLNDKVACENSIKEMVVTFMTMPEADAQNYTKNAFNLCMSNLPKTESECKDTANDYYIAIRYARLIYKGIDKETKSNKIAQLFNPKMIGVDLAYFEQFTGIARNTYGNKKIYKIDGCEIEATVGNGLLHALKVDLSTNCTFDLNKFFEFSPNTIFPAPHLMTFGEFQSKGYGGRYLADCLNDCGNAYDPSVYLYWRGPRASGFLKVLLEVTLVAGDALEASNKWENAMVQAEGRDWVTEGRFNCGKQKYNKIALDAFENVKISAITIGSGINDFSVVKLLDCSPGNL